jgi:hypothetical protein
VYGTTLKEVFISLLNGMRRIAEEAFVILLYNSLQLRYSQTCP